MALVCFFGRVFVHQIGPVPISLIVAKLIVYEFGQIVKLVRASAILSWSISSFDLIVIQFFKWIITALVQVLLLVRVHTDILMLLLILIYNEIHLNRIHRKLLPLCFADSISYSREIFITSSRKITLPYRVPFIILFDFFRIEFEHFFVIISPSKFEKLRLANGRTRFERGRLVIVLLLFLLRPETILFTLLFLLQFFLSLLYFFLESHALVIIHVRLNHDQILMLVFQMIWLLWLIQV